MRWSLADGCGFAFCTVACSRVVFSEAWSVLDWIIAKLVKVFGEFHIGDYSRLF